MRRGIPQNKSLLAEKEKLNSGPHGQTTFLKIISALCYSPLLIPLS
jgi:hypothetical protein